MVEKVITYQFSKRFKKEYKNLPMKIQKVFDKKLALFLKDMSHPSLRVKRIQGTNDRGEGSISMKYRSTFEFLQDVVLFRTIGTHDRLKR